MSPEEFVRVLEGVITADNALRQHAEQTFNSFVNNQPDVCLRYLVEVARAPALELYIKELALVLFRRVTIAQEDSLINKINHESKSFILQAIQSALMDTANESLRMKIAEIAGELAGGILEASEWPSLHQLTGDLCNNSPRAEDKLIGLCLLGYIADSALTLSPQFLPNAALTLQNAFQFFAGNGHGSVVTVTAVYYLLQSVQQPSQIDTVARIVPSLFQSFGQLIHGALANGASEKSKGAWKDVMAFLECLIDIAEQSIAFLQNHFELFVPPLFTFVETEPRLPKNLKFQMIELLVTLCTKNPKKTKKVVGPKGKKAYFLTELLKIAEQFMEQVHEHPTWETLDTVEELEGNSLSFFDVGESAFRRCIHALGVTHTYKKISALLTKNFTAGQGHLNSHPEQAWKRLYAALMMVAGYVETTTNVEDPHVLALHRHEVLTMLVQYIQFPAHAALSSVAVARIRFAAFNALSSYLLYHGSALKEEDVHRMFPLIVSQLAVSVNPAPRVRRAVLIALIHLMENVSNMQILAQYSAMVLSAICQAIQEGHPHPATIVQESSIAALTSFMELTRSGHHHHHGGHQSSSEGAEAAALISPALWLQIYQNIAPLLKELLALYQRRNLEMLWGQTLECITLLGEVVGKEVFYTDAQELLVFLQSMQASVTPHSDADIAMLKATVRVARCLGGEFLPHLHATVTRIFDALSVNVVASDNDLTGKHRHNDDDDDGDDDEDDDDMDGGDEDDEDDGLQMMETLDGTWVTVRTALIEEQSQALQMLSLLLTDTTSSTASASSSSSSSSAAEQQHQQQQQQQKQQFATRLAAFYPYVQQTAQFLQQALLKSPHEDIRAETLSLLPKLLQVTEAAHQWTAKQELLVFALGMVLPYLEKETNVELIMTGLVTLRALILQTAAGTATASATAVATGGSVTTSLTPAQMEAIVTAIKMIMRDSLQRRAMMRAELQMNAREDHDAAGRGGRGGGIGGGRGGGGGVFRTAPADSDEEDDGTGEDDDQHDQEYAAMFQETIELHFHLSQAMNALFVTHQGVFLPVYVNSGAHEMVVSLSHGYCFVEDRRLAFLVLCDVLEYGIHSSMGSAVNFDVAALTSQVIQILGNCLHEAAQAISAHDTMTLRKMMSISAASAVASKLTDSELVGLDTEVIRCAAFGLGVIQRRLLYHHAQETIPAVPAVVGAIEATLAPLARVLSKMTLALLPHVAQLQQLQATTDAEALASSTSRFTLETVGAAVDNVVRALGIVCHSRLTRPTVTLPVMTLVESDELMEMFLHYLQYLPMQHDVEEGEHALVDLLDMLPNPGQPPSPLAWALFDPAAGTAQSMKLFTEALVALVKTLYGVEKEELVGITSETVEAIAARLYHLLQGPQRLSDDYYLLPHLMATLQTQPSAGHHQQASSLHAHRVGGDAMVDYNETLARCLQAVAIYGSLAQAAAASVSS